MDSNNHQNAKEHAAEKTETAVSSQENYLRALELRNEQLAVELDFIKSSRGFRVLERLRTLPFVNILVSIGKILMPGEALPVPGSSSGKNQKAALPNPSPGEANTANHSDNINDKMRASSSSGRLARSAKDQNWINEQTQNPQPLSINHPEWRGILSSARELFSNILTIPEDMDESRATYYAELINEAAPPSVTIQGFPISYYQLVKALKRTSPNTPIFIIYHGNFLHTQEDYSWESFKLIKALFDEGDIQKVGFVKKGMAEVLANAGIRSQFLTNIVRRIPEKASTIEANFSQIGIWSYPDWNWKKLPYAMLASLKLIPDCRGYIHNISPRAQEFGRLLGINAEYQIDSIPHEFVLIKMSKMHINMNISLTECAPMVPLESLSMGSPCLFGPTSHYFLDHPYLHSRLVVPYPDNTETIAEYAIQALKDRDEIINAYIDYAPAYNQQAIAMLEAFLEHPIRK